MDLENHPVVLLLGKTAFSSATYPEKIWTELQKITPKPQNRELRAYLTELLQQAVIQRPTVSVAELVTGGYVTHAKGAGAGQVSELQTYHLLYTEDGTPSGAATATIQLADIGLSYTVLEAIVALDDTTAKTINFEVAQTTAFEAGIDGQYGTFISEGLDGSDKAWSTDDSSFAKDTTYPFTNNVSFQYRSTAELLAADKMYCYVLLRREFGR